ncbi:MAG: MBL fold metallo-hydrolase [Bacteroidales bacterium]|nr:MBL fold metallo-hydrolase [Bacteroidales bacterium]
MKLTYVYHSCCAIEFKNFAVIIDYYKDATKDGEETGWVKKHLLQNDKPLYVLCTHSHADHFNEEVLKWDAEKENITYIFSKEVADTLSDNALLKDEKITYLDKFETYRDKNIKVQAFGSTDEGGSFYIEHKKKKIFHAGDLNNWHWNEEVPREEALAFENHYICELELLYEQVKKVDVAMFPIDPRLGKDFMRGGEQFVEKIKTKHFLPLHFGDNYELIQQFEPIAQKAKTKVLLPEHTVQSFEL